MPWLWKLQMYSVILGSIFTGYRSGVNGSIQSRQGRPSVNQGRGGQDFNQNRYSLQASTVRGQLPHTTRGQQIKTRGTRINTTQRFRGQFNNGGKTTAVNHSYAGGQLPSLMNLPLHRRAALGRTLRGGRGRAQVSNVQRRVVLSENVALQQSSRSIRLNW